jgi:hypothetical protein
VIPVLLKTHFVHDSILTDSTPPTKLLGKFGKLYYLESLEKEEEKKEKEF